MSKKKATTIVDEQTAESMVDDLGPDLCLALAMCADGKPSDTETLELLRDRGLVESGSLILTEWGNEVLDAITERYCETTEDYSFERCDLTQTEQAEYGKRLAENHNEIRRHENELQAYKDQKKAEVSRCESEINALSTALGNGYEVRRVPVDVFVDRLQSRFVKTRKDTGEILINRALDSFEKQLPIPGIPQAAPSNN